MKNKFIQSTFLKLNLDKIYKTDFLTANGDKVYNIIVNENESFTLNGNDIDFENKTIRIKLFTTNGEERNYLVYSKNSKSKIEATANDLVDVLINNGYEVVKKTFNWSSLTEEQKIAILTK